MVFYLLAMHLEETHMEENIFTFDIDKCKKKCLLNHKYNHCVFNVMDDPKNFKDFSFIQTAKLAESEGTLRASGMRGTEAGALTTALLAPVQKNFILIQRLLKDDIILKRKIISH
jgi:hypothetical protein